VLRQSGYDIIIFTLHGLLQVPRHVRVHMLGKLLVASYYCKLSADLKSIRPNRRIRIKSKMKLIASFVKTVQMCFRLSQTGGS
jgi:hypothetical protein